MGNWSFTLWSLGAPFSGKASFSRALTVWLPRVVCSQSQNVLGQKIWETEVGMKPTDLHNIVNFHPKNFKYVIGMASWQSIGVIWVPSKTRICVFAGFWDSAVLLIFLVFVLRSRPATNCGCWSACFSNFHWPCAMNDKGNLVCIFHFHWPRA